MIVKHFDRGWEGNVSADEQQKTIRRYLKQFFNDDSCTVLINTTWINSIPDDEKSIDEYASQQYRIFAGVDWPSLEEILFNDNIFPTEILKFKLNINNYKSRLESTYHHILDYIFKNRNNIDNIIVYSLADPGIDIKLPKKFNIIKIFIILFFYFWF